jgi:hypothetical protein
MTATERRDRQCLLRGSKLACGAFDSGTESVTFSARGRFSRTARQIEVTRPTFAENVAGACRHNEGSSYESLVRTPLDR